MLLKYPVGIMEIISEAMTSKMKSEGCSGISKRDRVGVEETRKKSRQNSNDSFQEVQA